MSKPAHRTSAPSSITKTPITPRAVARVQGAVASQHGGGLPKGAYVGRMQQTVAKPPQVTTQSFN